MGENEKINAFNMYKLIAKQDTPIVLLSVLAEKLMPLSKGDIKDGWAKKCYECSDESGTLASLKDQEDGVYQNYLYFFQVNGFYNN